jgi:hypothetical protein
MNTLLRHVRTARQILDLPVARLCFDSHIDPHDIPSTYRYYTKPHPRYRIIRHKTIGAALIDLERFADTAGYLDSIQGKNRGAYHAKRARSRGYTCTLIERNDHIDDIHAINTSLDVRQGRPMDGKYLGKITRFERQPHFDYYGVLHPDGHLVAYGNIGRYGNFSAFSQLMGLRNNDGIMHLLVTDIVARLIVDKRVRYVMYDTFFGAQSGMQQFKRILGFAPYRAKYSLL